MASSVSGPGCCFVGATPFFGGRPAAWSLALLWGCCDAPGPLGWAGSGAVPVGPSMPPLGALPTLAALAL